MGAGWRPVGASETYAGALRREFPGLFASPAPLGHTTPVTIHAERPWPAIAPSAETLLVPLGSTEQHGPHLPLDTDTRIAVAIATAAAEQVLRAVVAPAVAYGSSGEHQSFPGTLSIGTEALAMVLIELGRSALPPFSRLVIVNGHGGNAASVRAAVATLQGEGRRAEAWWPDLGAGDPHADAHAGHTETSLLLHLCPHLVALDRAAPGNTEPIADLVPRLMADGVEPHAPTGVLGDPTTASAQRGNELFGGLVASLVETLGGP